MRHSTFSHVPPCSGLRLTLKTFWPISHRCTAVERRRKTISWAMPKPFLEGHTIVEALDDSNDIVFYTHTLCPYAQRVWLTLLEKGADFQPVQIDLANKPAFYRAISSLVPAISYQGSITTESVDICRWINDGLDGRKLAPTDEAGMRAMSALISSSSSINSAGLELLAGRTGRSWGIGTGQSDGQRKSFEAVLKRLDGPLAQLGGPFLTGKEVSLADLVLFPFIERFAIAMPEFAAYDVRHAFGGSIGAWLSSMAERPACRIASADSSLLLEAFRHHRSLDFFDFTTYSATQLHPHLAGHGDTEAR